MDAQDMVRRLTALRNGIRRDRRELSTLPEGHLLEVRKGEKHYYVHYNKRKYRGITKQKALIRRLMRKAFLEERVRRYRLQIQGLSQLAKTTEPIDTATILNSLIKARPFLTVEGCLHNEKTGQWIDEEYEKNPLYPERCIHYTGNGVATRSKEEKEIGNILENKNIAYRYDWIQYVGGKHYAPDFTVLRESDGKMIFWEHFGLISDEGYRENIYAKILHYESCGLHLWDNFIITFPKADGSLDTANIDKICEVFMR